ncbi:ABA_G0028270.mRNA.1.CDS.1 [Saccharomyces cerevisiae]|nr:ABA_G0028270.mRNA.1.CDS.1 [Saccharomyces cerevisiae]CAI6730256.1 ABA_G0028270.mRNA.1.CDS.1 [Saccharomyces cerevisiae]
MDFHTVKDGDTELRCPIPDTFDASAIIKSYVKEASEQGIHLRKAGVAMECVSVEGLDSSFFGGPNLWRYFVFTMDNYQGYP